MENTMRTDESVLARSMLPGAPWLLAHQSMLAVNQPQKYPSMVLTM
jgi:hypothetical protein